MAEELVKINLKGLVKLAKQGNVYKGYRLMLKRLELTSRRIIIPMDARGKEMELDEGVVIQLGERTDQEVPWPIKIGDIVCFGKYCGTPIAIGKEVFYMINETDILRHRGKKEISGLKIVN